MNVEEGNLVDRHAITVLKDGEIVGHMPRTIARSFWFFLKRGGSIKALVPGKIKKGRGLEVPCDYIYSGPRRTIKKLEKLLS